MKKRFEEFEARYLNLLTDFGFHKIFGTESNKDLLIDFLNLIIREEGLITDIHYLQPEQLGKSETDRKAIFDIFCVTENGEYFIVEMQKAKRFFQRQEYLLCYFSCTTTGSERDMEFSFKNSLFCGNIRLYTFR